MIFLKEHLLGDYNWADTNGAALYTGTPSRRAFDRYNGDQVLFVINLCATKDMSINEGRKMEALLLNHLPMENKSELSVVSWLRNMITTMPEEQINFIKQ